MKGTNLISSIYPSEYAETKKKISTPRYAKAKILPSELKGI